MAKCTITVEDTDEDQVNITVSFGEPAPKSGDQVTPAQYTAMQMVTAVSGDDEDE